MHALKLIPTDADDKHHEEDEDDVDSVCDVHGNCDDSSKQLAADRDHNATPEAGTTQHETRMNNTRVKATF